MGTIRFTLAMLVVVSHLIWIPQLGHLAVQAFFVLSGFLMTLVMQNSYSYSPQGFSRFWTNRVLRLYPTYLVLLVFAVIVIMMLGEDRTRAFFHNTYLPSSFKDWFQNLTFIYWNWQPFEETPRLSEPSWALTVEMFYYLLISLGISRTRRRTWIWFGVSFLWHLWAIASGKGLAYSYFHIASGSLPFAMGALIWHYRQLIDQWIDRLPYKTNTVALTAIAVGMAGLFTATGVRFLIAELRPYHPLRPEIISIVMLLHAFCALLLILGTTRYSLKAQIKKWDSAMGDLSYPIYISHFAVGVLAAQLTGLTTPGLNELSLVNLAVTIPIMLALCWLLIKLVDEPVQPLRAAIRQQAIRHRKEISQSEPGRE